MSIRHFVNAGLIGATLLFVATGAHAKGSGGTPNPCSISLLRCPYIVPVGSGSFTDELVNGSFSAATLAIAYSAPMTPGGTLSFALSGPGNGANLLPFLVSTSLIASDGSGKQLFSLSATNYDPTGTGSTAYLNPTSQTLGGVTLSESVTGFEGGFTFQAFDRSTTPVVVTLDVTIQAAGYGQVTVTNDYTLTAIPEPSIGAAMIAGLVVLAGAASRGRRALDSAIP